MQKSVAPYNFISLDNRVKERYEKIEELPCHDKYYSSKDGYFSGYIDYNIEALSPIIISNGASTEQNETKRFFKSANGEKAVPGSTVRGLVRNNLQILGLCSFGDDIQDTLYMYRALADKNPKIKKQYESAIDIKPMDDGGERVPGKVKAGYIYKDKKGDDSSYKIISAKDYRGKTFFDVRETKLRQLKVSENLINYMYNKDIMDFKNIEGESNEDRQNRWYGFIKNKKSNKFQPYCIPILFKAVKLDNGGIRLEDIQKYTNNSDEKGHILCSGFMPKKISHYIINDIDMDKESISISKDEIRAYNDDMDRKYGTSRKRYSFYELPEKSGIDNAKAIFYAENDGRNYFGFTPYLRIFYKYSVLSGVPECHKKPGLDYSKSMFGFADKEKSYKSRLSFEDAIIFKESKELQEVELILGGPKATNYPDYLIQNNESELQSYNDEGFKIRGVKQYWLKDSINNGPKVEKHKVATKFKPLDKGVIFNGKIHFFNLKEDELGLLLWSLKLNEDSIQNIGLAKPYGYGKVKIKDVSLKIEDLDKKYNEFSFDFYEEENIDSYIKKYKDCILEEHEINIDDVRSVKELFAMKSIIMKYEESHYMDLKEFGQKKVLPNVLEIVDDHKNKHFESRKKETYNEEYHMGDKIIVCKDCGKEFVFSVGEQAFYKEKGFQNEPKRCPSCRKARKQQKNL